MFFQQLDYLCFMRSDFFRLLLLCSLGAIIMTGCQSDEEQIILSEAHSVKVLVFDLDHPIDMKVASKELKHVQGFLFATLKKEDRLIAHFAEIASDEYLKKRSKEVLSDHAPVLVSVSSQKVHIPELAQSDGSEATGVRKAIEKPSAPVQQFPNVFDLFRFLF